MTHYETMNIVIDATTVYFMVSLWVVSTIYHIISDFIWMKRNNRE